MGLLPYLVHTLEMHARSFEAKEGSDQVTQTQLFEEEKDNVLVEPIVLVEVVARSLGHVLRSTDVAASDRSALQQTTLQLVSKALSWFSSEKSIESHPESVVSPTFVDEAFLRAYCALVTAIVVVRDSGSNLD